MPTSLSNERVGVEKVVSAFFQRRPGRAGFTSRGTRYATDGTTLTIWGNAVAKWVAGHTAIWLSDAGWRTSITKQMLNSIMRRAGQHGFPSPYLHQKKFEWYYGDGQPWQGSMILTKEGLMAASGVAENRGRKSARETLAVFGPQRPIGKGRNPLTVAESKWALRQAVGSTRGLVRDDTYGQKFWLGRASGRASMVAERGPKKLKRRALVIEQIVAQRARALPNPKSEYRTVDTSTLAGLKVAERLHTSGWKIARSGPFTTLFYRTKPATGKKRHNPLTVSEAKWSLHRAGRSLVHARKGTGVSVPYLYGKARGRAQGVFEHGPKKTEKLALKLLETIERESSVLMNSGSLKNLHTYDEQMHAAKLVGKYVAYAGKAARRGDGKAWAYYRGAVASIRRIARYEGANHVVTAASAGLQAIKMLWRGRRR